MGVGVGVGVGVGGVASLLTGGVAVLGFARGCWRRTVGDPIPRVRRHDRIHRRDRAGRYGLVVVVIATAATAGGQKEGKGGNAA